MKILFIVSWYSEFNASVIREGIFHYEQALALNKYKEVEVAIYFPFDETIPCNFTSCEERNVHVFRRRKTHNRLKRYKNYITDFLRIKQEYAPDIIHAHTAGGAGQIACFWKKIFHISYIVTEHAPIELMHLEKNRQFFIHKYVYKNSFKNICVSEDLCNRLLTKFPKYRFDVIYNGISLPEKSLSNSDIIIKKSKGINCAVVAAFYDKEIKGFQFLLPAMRKLLIEGFDICLHVCGGGTYLDYYKNLASELGITDRCIFYNQIEKYNVYSLVSQMDFVISSSLVESAGVSVEEAMLLGKPLVVTKSGGANSLVTEKTAIIVDKGSTEALVKGIKKMIMLLDKFESEDIKKYAYQKFEMSSVCRQYIDLYRQIL